MTDTTTIARPYAKAAFDYAYQSNNPTSITAESGANAIQQWSEYLNIAKQIVEDAEFQSFSILPHIDDATKIDTLLSFYDTRPSEQFVNFIKQLAENDRLLLLADIADQFDSLKSKVTQQVNVDIISAYPLSESQTQVFANKLRQSLDAQVIIHNEVDPSLIGGAKVKIGDKVVDASVKGKLRKLKSELTI